MAEKKYDKIISTGQKKLGGKRIWKKMEVKNCSNVMKEGFAESFPNSSVVK